jgi:LPXTG-site transpeptidase (sortase) family protein
MGRSDRLNTLLSGARSRASRTFRRYPRVAFPVSGGAVLGVCGLLVWLVAFNGGGAQSSSDVLSDSASATSHTTLTPSATPATATPDAAMQAAAAATPAPSGSTGQDSEGPASGSGMRFKIPSIGVDAPVTVRVMGSDGAMGEPNGKDDVVWYDFSAWSGMGGYPGAGGNAVFSGHVDYHPHYEAVFWDLHLVGPGDLIEVDLPDGSAVRYSVQWSKQIGPDDEFSGYVSRTGEETITIVTCQGTFNSTTRQYDHRLVVRGVRIP